MFQFRGEVSDVERTLRIAVVRERWSCCGNTAGLALSVKLPAVCSMEFQQTSYEPFRNRVVLLRGWFGHQFSRWQCRLRRCIRPDGDAATIRLDYRTVWEEPKIRLTLLRMAVSESQEDSSLFELRNGEKGLTADSE